MATRLDLAYDRQVHTVRTSVASFAARTWLGLGSYRDDDAKRFRAAVVPRVEASQKRIAELADAYTARVAAAELGRPISRGAVAVASTQALRGVPAVEVYERPFVEVYTKLSEGKSFTAAKLAGAARLASIVNTGMQLASTHAARRAMERSDIETYERELTGRENCALCVIASTQRYWRGDLMPIHGGCDCRTKPRRGDPTDQVINPVLLERMHAAVEGEFGGSDRGTRIIDGLSSYNDYMDLIVTNVHGEIGPVLAWRHQHFTSLAEIQRTL